MRLTRSRVLLGLAVASAVTTYPDPSPVRVAKTIKRLMKDRDLTKTRLVKLESASSQLGKLAPLLAMSTAQLTALATLSAAQLTDLAALTTGQLAAVQGCSVAQLNFLGGLTSTQLTYLDSLRILPKQSDNQTSLTGTENWSDNLTDDMIDCGLMSPT